MSTKRKASMADSRGNGKQRVGGDEQEDLLDDLGAELSGFSDDGLADLAEDGEEGEEVETGEAVEGEGEDDDLGTGLEEEGEASEAEADDADDAEVELPLSAEQLQTEEKLDFRSLSISAAQARGMARLLCGNEALTTIKFEGHDLAISELKEEEELEWDSEDYTDVEAIIIAEFLKSNTSIKRLDLARNLIADDGACALAKALSENTSLEYLNLESNSVAEKGGKALSRAVASNPTLQYLNLSFNAIPSAMQQVVRDLWTEARQGQLGLHL